MKKNVGYSPTVSFSMTLGYKGYNDTRIQKKKVGKKSDKNSSPKAKWVIEVKR